MYWFGQTRRRGSQPWYLPAAYAFYELPSVFRLIATVYYIIKKEKDAV